MQFSKTYYFIGILAILIFGAASAFLFFSSSAQQERGALWADLSESAIERLDIAQADRLIIPDEARTVRVNISELDSILANAPHEDDVNIQDSEVEITLPMLDGSAMAFRVIESPIMHPDLAARYPDITTYIGQSTQNPTITGRFDRTPNGFHAIISQAGGDVYIDPYARGNVDVYNVYHQRGISSSSEFNAMEPILGRDSDQGEALQQFNTAAQSLALSGDNRLEYELAVSTTGEYAAYHNGGTNNKAPVLAEIVTAINRVNQIYERDLAVRLILIANNDALIFTNAATDPFSNFDAVALLSENQSTIDSIIGATNYDIGHVFSTGGGGLAWLESVCWTGNQAKGVTGLPNPVNDPFYIDYVAHEVGHQFGATHTFNGSSGSCSGTNRQPTTAYEPGSGSTVMAYAGICSPQNIQFQSDAMFHSASIDQVRGYVENTAPLYGGACPDLINTSNTPPTSDAGTGGVTIPVNTPFELTGSASDINGDALTYSWEQFDLGPTGAPNSPTGNAPLFRAFLPTSSPVRTFPQISDIVNNTQTMGEILPSYARSLTFRLVVRDNASASGGIATDSIAFNVANASGSFEVTNPNTNATYEGQIPVAWNVAGTNLAPFNCVAVNVLLSVDGGYTYPILLAENSPNDGAELVEIPVEGANQSSARVRVECQLNDTVTFFDISNTNFATGAPGGLRGDCNADGIIDAGDLSALALELDDGDTSDASGDISSGFAGNNIGCDANADVVIDTDDNSCIEQLIFDPAAVCASE